MQSPRTRNTRSVSVRHKGLNQKVERLNGVFRDREKVMREWIIKNRLRKQQMLLGFITISLVSTVVLRKHQQNKLEYNWIQDKIKLKILSNWRLKDSRSRIQNPILQQEWWVKLFSKYSDADKVVDITKKFFKYNYSACRIDGTTLQNNTWSVKVSVTLFGQHSSKTLVIDSKTGKIISCK